MGALIACMIRVFFSDVMAKPIPIVAAHSAQPIKAWIRIIINFLRLIISYCVPHKTCPISSLTIVR